MNEPTITLAEAIAALQRLATFEAFTMEGWGSSDPEVTARVNYARMALGLPEIEAAAER
jgi:hypothetical protein